MFLFQKKFTGWYDCPLSPKGHEEVVEAGQLIKKEGLVADVAYTSLLQRAIRTLWHVLEQTGLMWIPVNKKWELNERHYGACTYIFRHGRRTKTHLQHSETDLSPWFSFLVFQCKDWTNKKPSTSTEKTKS